MGGEHMTAQAYWKRRRDAAMAEMTAAKSNEELLHSYRRCMEDIKMSVLADMAQDSVLRQQVTLLFLQAEQGAEILLTRGEPMLCAGSMPEQRQPAIWRLLRFPALLYGVLGCGAAVCLLSGLPGLPAIPFFVLAAVLVHLHEGQPSAGAQTWTAVCELRAEALKAHIDRQTQLLDAHIQDLRTLLEEIRAPLPELPLDGDVMGLCQQVWASAKQNQPLEGALNAVERLLERSELEWVEYAEKTRQLYEVMPTRRESRTVFPALVKKSDGTLASRGQRLENR